MSRRNVLKKYQLLNNEESSASIQSKETDVQQLDFVTYQLEIESTVNAFLSVYFSNDERFDPTNIRELNFETQMQLDGSVDSQYLIHIENPGFKWLLLGISDNGGNGGVSAWVTGNVRGA